MTIMNAVSFGAANISPTYAGPSFFNSPGFNPSGLSRFNGENIQVAQVYSSHTMASPVMSGYLSSLDPIDPWHEPEFTPLNLSRYDSSADRPPVMSATLNRQWSWGDNEYTQPDRDELFLEVSETHGSTYGEPAGNSAPVSPSSDRYDRISYSYPRFGEAYAAFSSTAAMNYHFNDIDTWSSMTPHLEEFQQNNDLLQQPRHSDDSGSLSLMQQLQYEVDSQLAEQPPRYSSVIDSPLRRQSQRSQSMQSLQETVYEPQVGIGRMSSFARNFYSHENLHARDSLREPLQNQSSARRRQRAYSTGTIRRNSSIGSFSDSGSFTSCNLTLGHEANELLSVLRTRPQREVHIEYTDNAGMDAGGLSRQAFDSAYRQLLNKEDGFFKKVNGQFELNPQATPQDAKDLGIILGRISRLDGGIGQDLGENFFKKMYSAGQILANTRSVEQLLATASMTQLQHILLDFDHETYGRNTDTRNYLLSMDREALTDEVKNNAGQYLHLAAAYKSAAPPPAHSHQQLMTQICGPYDLRRALLRSTRYVSDDAFSMSAIPRKRDYLFKIFNIASRFLPTPRVRQERQIESWFKRAINQADDEQLKNMSRNFTGGSTFNPQTNPVMINIRTNMDEDSDILYNAHTCFNSVDVNARVMMHMINNNDFDNFKAAIFGGAAEGFNRA